MLLVIILLIGGCNVDIFKFHNPTSPTKLERGEVVNNLKSKLWVERYREAGEFKFVADAKSGVKELLSTGSLISHVDSTEVMIVENHEISDVRGKEPEIIITGRGFETYFDQRIVGSNKTFPTSTGVADYVLASDNTWDQVVVLIEEHVLASELLNDDNEIPYLEVLTTASGSGAVEERILKRGTLYSRVLELLDIDDLGIKIVRPGPWSPLGGGSVNIAVVIHKGEDRSDEVIFSYDTGEIESADYLWSIKKLKNAAMISGKWVETVVFGVETKFNRRMMHVDASDIDETYSEAPVNPDLADIVTAMQQRGVEALAAQKEIALTKAEVSKDATKAVYRTDFDVGDLITVSGDYNETSTMRIAEYVEVEDETGMSGYPTLTMD